jgi:phosphoserine phosphatase RsbU/P
LILSSLLSMHHARIAALAEAWLHAGAVSFSLCDDQRVLAAWPPGVQPGQPTLSAPMEVAGVPVGALHVNGQTGPAAEARLKADAGLLSDLAAIENELENMTGELIERQDQLLALYELTQSTRSHLQIDDMLNALIRQATRLVKTELAFAYLEQPAGGRLFVQYPASGIDQSALLQLIDQSEGDHSGLLLNSSSAVLPAGVASLALLPIRIRGSAIAGLGLVNKSGGDFTSPDLKLMRAICDQAGAQIENILLYQEHLEQARLRTELDLAAQIQLRLLPQHLPRLPGLEIEAASRPALRVGGDFYDFIARPSGPVTLALGDVSGKGISASLLMSITHTVLRNAARFMPLPSPASIISRVNSDLYDDLTEVSMFVTAFVGQIDLEHRQLMYMNAGHSPVIYCPRGGPARLLAAEGLPLGIVPDDAAEDQVLPFNCGDVLVVASDGFSEASAPDGELFGYDRLLHLIERLAGGTAASMIQGMYDAVTTFGQNRPQDDDQTLIVVKATS